MGTISINGNTYSGNCISINNGNIIIDSFNANSSDKKENITIKIDGKIEKVSCDRDLTIYGSVGSVESKGSVNCNDVGKNVSSGGSVNCDNVGGSINAGGSVNCDGVSGSVTAGGSVRR